MYYNRCSDNMTVVHEKHSDDVAAEKEMPTRFTIFLELETQKFLLVSLRLVPVNCVRNGHTLVNVWPTQEATGSNLIERTKYFCVSSPLGRYSR